MRAAPVNVEKLKKLDLQLVEDVVSKEVFWGSGGRMGRMPTGCWGAAAW